ncbi:MAG: ATP-dependent DNA helicase UvrD2, partial [Actinomycetota bacterium]|nr:ATP-dependent DNA helicase UvrD2 [Actinomycetota bacterium]
PRQTIYSFTGASPSYLTRFPLRYPDAAVIRLVRNYRSTPEVVRLANRVFADPGQALVAQRPSGPPPALSEYPDEPAEVAAVAEQIAGLVAAGTPARQIAVLVRTNAMTAGYEEALGEAGVPYQLRGAERFFDRPEVRQAVGLLRASARSARDDAERDLDPASQVRPVLTGLGLGSSPPSGRGRARERWESLEALAQLSDDFFAANPGATLADLAAELDLRSAIGHAPDAGGVTLASLHAAKGLEWDVVFLPGLVDGTVPIIYAQSPEAVEEERRLLYVGVTRARQRLYLSWALSRTKGGRRTRKPSRFLDPLRDAGRGGGRGGGAGRAGSERAGGGRGGRRARGGDSGPERGDGTRLDEAARQLFDRLRQWRLETAREQSVPAYVVFSDATLELIAERAPRSREQLAAVPGVGAVKLDRYGAAVLALCAGAAAGAGGCGGGGGAGESGEPG